jgi:hypothetical protein
MPSQRRKPKTKGRKGICSVCAHDRRVEIDVGLCSLVPIATLVSRFDVSSDSLTRHRKNHLSPLQKGAILAGVVPSDLDLEALAKREGEGLLSALLGQRAILREYSSTAFAAGDVRSAVGAERGITLSLQLTSRLLGAIVNRSEHTSTSVLISSDYLMLRQTLLDTLRPFPAAAQAVGQALHELETRAAQDIAAKAARRQAPLTIEHRDGNGHLREVEP